MAKRNSDPEARPDKGKIRLLYAEVDGNNESLQEALRTMLAAMNKPVHVIGTQVGTQNRIAHNPGSALNADPEADVSENEEVTDTENSDAPESGETSPPRKRGVGPKKDRNIGINLVPDLDFHPNGKQSLREFVSMKAPKNDMEHIVVLVYYMQHTLALPAIGPGHIRTAFKDISVALPIDLKGTIRNLRRDKAWLKFTDIEAIQVATAGENLVDHDLPSGKKS